MPKAIITDGVVMLLTKPAQFDKAGEGRMLSPPEWEELQPGTLIEVSDKFFDYLRAYWIARAATPDEARRKAIVVPDY